MIVCIAFMSPKANNPLFLKMYCDGVDEIRFQHVCYCSLDVFEEKEQAIRGSKAADKMADTFLGHLLHIEDYKLAGYVTSSGVRIAIVFDESDSKDESKDSNLVKAFMRKLHSLYTDCISNPFYQAGQVLSSPKLEKDVATLVRLWNSDAFR